MANVIYVGDVGTIVELTIKDENQSVVNVSGATLKQVKFKKPNSTSVITQTAAFSTDGVDGKIRYVTLTGDIDTVGDWLVKAYIELGANVKFYTDYIAFQVASAT